MSGHRGSPRRAPRASLPAFNPSRKPRPHSASRGVAGCPREGVDRDYRLGPRGRLSPHNPTLRIIAAFLEKREKTNRTISPASRPEINDRASTPHRSTQCSGEQSLVCRIARSKLDLQNTPIATCTIGSRTSGGCSSTACVGRRRAPQSRQRRRSASRARCLAVVSGR